MTALHRAVPITGRRIPIRPPAGPFAHNEESNQRLTSPEKLCYQPRTLHPKFVNLWDSQMLACKECLDSGSRQ